MAEGGAENKIGQSIFLGVPHNKKWGAAPSPPPPQSSASAAYAIVVCLISFRVNLTMTFKKSDWKLKLRFYSVVYKVVTENFGVPVAIRYILGGKKWRPQASPGFFREIPLVT